MSKDLYQKKQASQISTHYSSVKKTTSSKKRKTKGFSNFMKICFSVLFLVGFGLGYLFCNNACKDDCFEILGSKTCTIFIDSTYIDEGVKVIGFGKDLSSSVKYEIYKDGKKLEASLDEIDTTEECIYQIVYTVDNFRFKNIKLIRTLNIVEEEIVSPEDVPAE